LKALSSFASSFATPFPYFLESMPQGCATTMMTGCSASRRQHVS
jgi:hypothetical protein